MRNTALEMCRWDIRKHCGRYGSYGYADAGCIRGSAGSSRGGSAGTGRSTGSGRKAQAQAQNQAAYEEEQRQAEKDELLGEIVSDLGGKAIDRTSSWIEEETNGVFDRELQGKDRRISV